MKESGPDGTAKITELDRERRANTGKVLTSDTGMRISDDQRTLRAGRRGPTLLQDIHFYRKQSRFNRERIPEKVVHARGFGVHGYFELEKSLRDVTRAHFLQEPGTRTPVFVRFSTFIGSRGSKDTAVDVRGFATKFYTQEGNYDNLALSFPVFVMKDAMQFADFTHAVKPNPKTDVPQAAAAHDTLWDYVANNQESAHFIMWLMSMRGRPRSWRMMESWPVNTFRMINAEGESTYCRFVWKPELGVHSLLLEEANIIGGVDPDFHRHDMIEAIEKGAYPKFGLGVQLISEEDEFAYDFDILDDTKLWPEETIPVQIVGTMTLDRLVDNFFAEEEQSSFDPSTLVPGIDFTNDPVLQGRTFAYRDTDYHRLSTGNINEIPINRPVVETNYNFRDSYVRHRIDSDLITYRHNSLADDTPTEAAPEEGGFTHYPGKVEGEITREYPSDKFDDHFSQARLFWNSMTEPERKDLIETFVYHLGKVKSKSVRQQTVEMFANVDTEMAAMIADQIGVTRPTSTAVEVTDSSPAISLANTPHSARTQKVGVLIADGFDGKAVKSVLQTLEDNGVFIDLISDRLGVRTGSDGTEVEVHEIFFGVHPALYDSLYIVGGQSARQEEFDQRVQEFFRQAYRFYQPIGVASSAEPLVRLADTSNGAGVIFESKTPEFGTQYLEAIAQRRFWDRSQPTTILRAA